MTHRLVAQARKHIGSPYVWGGKGHSLFNLEHLNLELSHWDIAVFDCSGLITVSLWELGFCDWRGSHNAAALQRECEDVDLSRLEQGDLLFRPGHVAIFVSGNGDKARVIEACGGDQSTRSPAAAAKRNAFVKEHEVSPRGVGLKWPGRLRFTFATTNGAETPRLPAVTPKER